jgi:hypothetical protein
MADPWREFSVEAYNARLARSAGEPYRLVAQEARTAARVPKLLESDVLPAVLKALRIHPKVAFAWRQNSGAQQVDGRYIQYAFPGCSDILGMLKDGRFLAVEVKRPGGMPTPAQVQFLAVVEQNGGLGLVARGIEDVMAALA